MRSRSLIGVTILLTVLPVGMLTSQVVPARARSSAYSVFVEPSAGVAPVTQLISSAKHSIRLELYELTDESVFSALEASHKRGVNVQVMLEKHPLGGAKYARSAFRQLKKHKVHVRWANESAYTYTHEKSIVIDGRTAGIFTLNLTSSGTEDNREFGVVDHHRADARAIQRVFKADWNRKATPKLDNAALVVSPVNARPKIAGLIDHAQKSLDLYEEEIDDSGIESDLTKAVKRHVRVRLLTSENSAGTRALKKGGVKVHFMSSPYVHAKVIVADHRRAFVGSENISTVSLNENREMGIVLQDSPSITVLSSQFSADWKATKVANHGHLPLSVSADPATIQKGDLETISGQTSGGASCSVKVVYPDGYVSRAEALDPKYADSSGYVAWSWHVESTSTGTSHVTVSCSLDGASHTTKAVFTIDS
jgi:cardiolipin synthase